MHRFAGKLESVAARTYSCFCVVCITLKHDACTNKMQISEFHSQVLHLKKSHTLNTHFSTENNVVKEDDEQFVVASIVIASTLKKDTSIKFSELVMTQPLRSLQISCFTMI